MKKLIIISILLTTSAHALSLKKLHKRLKRELKIDLNIKEELIRNSDNCTRLILENWYYWWKEVKSPHKEKYLTKIQKLKSLNILNSNLVQNIEGSYTSVHLVKNVCSGSGMGRSCKTHDSVSLKLKKNITKTGEDPKFDLKVDKTGEIIMEYSSDFAVSKRYDTFSRVVYENVERDNKLFDKYSRYGQIYQLVRPGTDSSLKVHCSYPRLDQIISQIK
jgi:hypothetical protein